MLGRTRKHLATILTIFATSGVYTPAAAMPQSRVIYAYLAEGGRWCAVNDLKSFKAVMASNEPSQFDVDQAEIRLVAGRPVSVKEFRTDEDAEWSTMANYSLNGAGLVTSVTILVREGQPLRQYNLHFSVEGGEYKEVKHRLGSVAFRKPTAISSFPFSNLVGRLNELEKRQKICD